MSKTTLGFILGFFFGFLSIIYLAFCGSKPTQEKYDYIVGVMCGIGLSFVFWGFMGALLG